MGIFAQLIVNGIIAGSIYALVALGYTMVYGILKFINFAHGEVFMFGAFFGYVFATILGWNIFLSLFLAVLLAALLGMLIERVAYRRLRNAGRLSPLITAIALSLLLQSIALIIFGSGVRSFWNRDAREFVFFGATITDIQLLIIIMTVILLVGLYYFVKHTKMGKSMRATADNLHIAQTVGIDTNKTIVVVFALGSALAGIAGVLIAMEQSLDPVMGVPVGIKAFTAAVVGGIGSIPGAVVGGLVIGLAENLGIWFIPSGFKDAIAFLILLLMLLFRPSGFFGKKSVLKGADK